MRLIRNYALFNGPISLLKQFSPKHKFSQSIANKKSSRATLNEIQTMFSQLAKQSHWKLSADCSIAHEHIRPVDLPVNTFSNGN